jgi:hypothetical protein
MDEWTNQRTNEWTNERMKTKTNEWMNERKNESTNEWLIDWLNALNLIEMKWNVTKRNGKMTWIEWMKQKMK